MPVTSQVRWLALPSESPVQRGWGATWLPACIAIWFTGLHGAVLGGRSRRGHRAPGSGYHGQPSTPSAPPFLGRQSGSMRNVGPPPCRRRANVAKRSGASSATVSGCSPIGVGPVIAPLETSEPKKTQEPRKSPETGPITIFFRVVGLCDDGGRPLAKG